MKFQHILLLALIFLTSCRWLNQKNANLPIEPFPKEVIYVTENLNFHFDYFEILKHCEKEDNDEDNDFIYRDLHKYITNYPNDPILIPDTLATKIMHKREVHFIDIEGDSLIRVRNQEHPHAYVTDNLPWIILKFARKERIRIFHKEKATFLTQIKVVKIDTKNHGVTVIKLKDNSEIYSVLRWI